MGPRPKDDDRILLALWFSPTKYITGMSRGDGANWNSDWTFNPEGFEVASRIAPSIHSPVPHPQFASSVRHSLLGTKGKTGERFRCHIGMQDQHGNVLVFPPGSDPLTPDSWGSMVYGSKSGQGLPSPPSKDYSNVAWNIIAKLGFLAVPELLRVLFKMARTQGRRRVNRR